VVAAAVFLVLAGVLYWSERHKPAEDAGKAPAGTLPAILKLDASAITGLELEKKDARPIVLVRANPGEWKITQPQALGADQSAVSGVLSSLSSLNAERVVEDKAADLRQYGLAQPAVQLSISDKDNKTRRLLIGDDTPTGGAAYAMLAGDPRIFTIVSYAKTGVDKTLDDLRDKRLLTVNPDKVSRIELTAKNQTVEFGRNKDEWQILKPRPLRADSFQVSELARKLADARMDLGSPDTEDLASAFAHATPLATAKVTDESGSQELQVRESQVGKTEHAYYAKSSAVAGIYKISADSGKNFDKTLNDFRNKKLFEFGFSDPSALEVKGVTYTKSGDKWMNGSKAMDNTSVQNLIDKLRDLSSSSFDQPGGGSAVLDVAVTSNQGKRTEKVSITKMGDKYFAKRQDDPSIYGVDAMVVDDLQKAVSGLKEAAPPAQQKK